LNEASDIATSLKKMNISRPLNHNIQDNIKDDTDPLSTMSDVHLKEQPPAELNSEILEKYLNILARVFKNSDGIEYLDLIYEIFDFLLEAYSFFGLYMIDQFSMMTVEDLQENASADWSDYKIGENLVRVLTNFIPILTQVLL